VSVPQLLLAGSFALGLLGKPLFYWGARPPAIRVESAKGDAWSSVEAGVTEVHTALCDNGDLVLRLTFDREVERALHLPDGRPVSGRLQAVLYLDGDGDRTTGLDAGARDLRTGADRRLTIGVLSLGEDDQEGRAATALVVATLSAIEGDFFERPLWLADDEAQPENVSWRGEWLEVRLPAGQISLGRTARLVLAQGGRMDGGRVIP
jgi:hypothetical protein